MKSELIFLLVAVAFSLLQWISERKKKEEAESKSDHREREHRELRRKRAREERSAGGATPEEERVRKFMEALGLPTDGPVQAPPPVAPKPAPPPERRPEPVVARKEPEVPKQPPVPARSEEKAPPRRTFPKPPRPRQIDRTFPSAPPSPYAARSAPAPAEPREAFTSTLAGLSSPVTGSSTSEIGPQMEVDRPGFSGRQPASADALVDFSCPQAIRRALVMAEVLGRPKGLA